MRPNDAALSPPLVLLRAALQNVLSPFLGLIVTLRSNDGFGGGNEIVNNLIFNYCRESSVRMSKRTPALIAVFTIVYLTNLCGRFCRTTGHCAFTLDATYRIM